MNSDSISTRRSNGSRLGLVRYEQLSVCPLCKSDDLKDLKIFFNTFGKDTGIFRCQNCRVSFSNPSPLEQDIPRFYTNRDSPSFPKANIFANYLRIIRNKMFVKKISIPFGTILAWKIENR